MPFAAALSRHPIPAEAVGEALGEILEHVGDTPDLAVLFATAPLTGALEDIAATVRAVLRPGTLLGSTAVSLLAGEREVEEESALALWAGTQDRSYRSASKPNRSKTASRSADCRTRPSERAVMMTPAGR